MEMTKKAMKLLADIQITSNTQCTMFKHCDAVVREIGYHAKYGYRNAALFLMKSGKLVYVEGYGNICDVESWRCK